MKTNEVRIIGGAWRSRRIHFPDRTGLRPTPDRVRETVFNWLGQDLTGLTCLDLFAGSGALGFEAASRGAARVVMVENDGLAYKALCANRDALEAHQVEMKRMDALEFLRSDAGDEAHYDVIFADPPFSADYWARLVTLLPACMKRGARVYCESREPPVWPAQWKVVKQGRAGQVVFQLIKWTVHESDRDLPGDIRSDHARP
ncbi:MAG: 16S rRNA (guanine(966)-N(2))-methyltransferase RsmD [Pseudomonadota bacterium]